jgi:glycosyltransferase involved in cell wall biosynthesis
MSVIDIVDKVLIYDTGSTDKTLEIIKEIKKVYPSKIIFREVGSADINEFTKIRQEMLNETRGDWVWILDADEVWWRDTAAKHRAMMSKDLDSIVVKYKNMVGDIYHVQPESASKYKIDGVEGNLTIRGMNMSVPGLKVDKPHGVQGFYDKKGTLIQKRNKNKRIHMGGISYLHFTHLIRSSSLDEDKKVPKRGMKYKKEIGINLPADYFYPEVFFIDRPDIVPTPWVKRNAKDNLEAALFTLPRAVKRKVWRKGSGY